MRPAKRQNVQFVAKVQPTIVPKPAEENPYGKEPESGKAPEAIAKTISAMPPEQMFELMKQMKQNVITDPAQTRRLLMENPQLAYALLQVILIKFIQFNLF
jgi:cleavage stimulation factor subunit 2